MATKVSKRLDKDKIKEYIVKMTDDELVDYIYNDIKRKELKRKKDKSRCKECGEVKEIGEKTKQCLSCLDWKMDDLNR